MEKDIMNRTDLVNQAYDELEGRVPKRIIDEVNKAIENVKLEHLSQGTNKRVQLIGFGTYEVRERSARNGRNPQTGEEIEIKASNTVAFKPGKYARGKVN